MHLSAFVSLATLVFISVCSFSTFFEFLSILCSMYNRVMHTMQHCSEPAELHMHLSASVALATLFCVFLCIFWFPLIPVQHVQSLHAYNATLTWTSRTPHAPLSCCLFGNFICIYVCLFLHILWFPLNLVQHVQSLDAWYNATLVNQQNSTCTSQRLSHWKLHFAYTSAVSPHSLVSSRPCEARPISGCAQCDTNMNQQNSTCTSQLLYLWQL